MFEIVRNPTISEPSAEAFNIKVLQYAVYFRSIRVEKISSDIIKDLI